MENHTETLATINNVAILVVQNGQKLVPIKPICEALGIDDKSQRDKIKEDEILNSTGVLSTLVAADNKEREMFCLPLQYVFGWLFTINPKNVREEARETVSKYRRTCYDVLFNHFAEQSEFLEEKAKTVDVELDNYRSLQLQFKTAKDSMEESKRRVDLARKMTIVDWKANNKQFALEL